ncbi:DUF11 domain-containing protein [Paenibacillus sp. NEAU-GSW1]|uniref:DUF7507 domain-containing protein n=1 Tax=Paenibacillus sp. NEAU-GSW1 TaxID=2682486 RepID=UPI0012E0E98F|nr:DUF11 domain-containing protein [Paenibacillus sp. NEAU-GSW1]MUT64657.1 DUF11 domain-containing protein [Paenibacillus sp. NEAU-GSW1]
MPFIVRFSGNDTGAVTFTGNTLGLSRSSTDGVPGTRDYIGAFTTIDTSMQFGSYPAGTTSDYNLNSASAVLRMPAESEVIYAELVWAGTYAVTGGTNNYFAFIDKSVTLTTPAGITYNIAPDPSTAQISHRNATDNYFRSANVTSQIQTGGAGVYTVGSVVGNIDLGNSTANSCGWTLCVIFRDPDMPFRNLSLNVGIVEIAFGSDPSVTTTLSGFVTPVEGAVHGRMALCAQDGDANKVGDQVLFGPDAANLTLLSGPNNFSNNFFASQINDDSGNLDTSGTFGERNQINGEPGTQIVGGRQSWDITNVDVSASLLNNQTSAEFQLRTTNDGYSVIAVGIFIDINSPRVTVGKEVDADIAELGQVLTYTVVISNTGTVSAETVFLLDILPNDTVFLPGSITVDGEPTPGDPVAGISLGTLAPDDTIIVTYQAIVVSFPEDGLIRNEALVHFEYQSVAGGEINTGEIPSNEVITAITPPVPRVEIDKTVNRTTAAPGDTVVYTIRVANTGLVTVTGIEVSDPLLGFVETIAVLEPGQTVVITRSFTIPLDAANGSVISNVATVVSVEAPEESDSSEVIVVVPPVIPPVVPPPVTVGKSASLNEAAVGETITYTIVIVNRGTVPIIDLRLSDVLQQPLVFVPGSVKVNGRSQPGARPEQILLGTIGPGEEITVSFSARPASLNEGEKVTNQAVASFRVEVNGPVFQVESNPVEVELTEDEE